MYNIGTEKTLAGIEKRKESPKKKLRAKTNRAEFIEI